jgi:hypothetical protein
LFSTGNGTTIGWVNTKKFLQTGDAEASQGWCPACWDMDGDGKINQALDRQMPGGGGNFGSYGIVVNPTDQSVWFASPGTPGKIVRMVRGSNPPETCLFESYEPPFNNPRAPGVIGFFPRGIDIDRNGVVWTALAGSGHIASFDRRKCPATTGANAADGQRCVQGWTLYAGPAPKMKGVTDDISADFYYYNWVDQFNTLGLGNNVPVATGTGSDSILAFDPTTKKILTMRVPYPLEFFARSVDGHRRFQYRLEGTWPMGAKRVRRPTGIPKPQRNPSVVAHFQLRPDRWRNENAQQEDSIRGGLVSIRRHIARGGGSGIDAAGSERAMRWRPVDSHKWRECRNVRKPDDGLVAEYDHHGRPGGVLRFFHAARATTTCGASTAAARGRRCPGSGCGPCRWPGTRSDREPAGILPHRRQHQESSDVEHQVRALAADRQRQPAIRSGWERRLRWKHLLCGTGYARARGLCPAKRRHVAGPR